LNSEDLEIAFKRSGGIFSGGRLELELDGAQLSPEEAAAWDQAAASPALTHVSTAEPPGTGADEFQYDLAIRRGGRTDALRFTESTVPTELSELVRLLERRAQLEARARRRGAE
jgi:hypothetical protein